MQFKIELSKKVPLLLVSLLIVQVYLFYYSIICYVFIFDFIIKIDHYFSIFIYDNNDGFII